MSKPSERSSFKRQPVSCLSHRRRESKIDVRFEERLSGSRRRRWRSCFRRQNKTSVFTLKTSATKSANTARFNCQGILRHFKMKAVVQCNGGWILITLNRPIISVGYRVKSLRGTQFRMWSTQRLREYVVKGFVLDDEPLKNPDLPFDYFEELTRRIQDIPTSERRFYQKITDIYATSIDYDPTQNISIRFLKTVQNKVHWAITGQTAAEIIHDRARGKQTQHGFNELERRGYWQER